jgi:2-oxoglutarate ferredoxin oxidoreductase subunit gamma
MSPKTEFMGEKVEQLSRIVIAGFGGQGVLFSGKLLAYAGLAEQREVSWIPSYGPEMRGGTANCHVVISPFEIGSPVVTVPDILIALNRPSMEKFEADVKPGGFLFYNTSLIDLKPAREDITYVGIPASGIAEEVGNPQIANVVVCGALVARTGIVQFESLLKALEKCVSKSRMDMMEMNRKALDKGAEFIRNL